MQLDFFTSSGANTPGVSSKVRNPIELSHLSTGGYLNWADQDGATNINMPASPFTMRVTVKVNGQDLRSVTFVQTGTGTVVTPPAAVLSVGTPTVTTDSAGLKTVRVDLAQYDYFPGDPVSH